MAANNNPLFGLTAKVGQLELSSANTTRDGSTVTGTTFNVFSAGTNGSRVDRIVFESAQASPAASSAMVGRVFLTDTSGLNPRLYREIALPTITASNTVIGQRQEIVITGGLVIPSGTIIRATISVYAGVQDKYHVTVEGCDF